MLKTKLGHFRRRVGECDSVLNKIDCCLSCESNQIAFLHSGNAAPEYLLNSGNIPSVQSG